MQQQLRPVLSVYKYIRNAITAYKSLVLVQLPVLYYSKYMYGAVYVVYVGQCKQAQKYVLLK